MKKYIPIIYIAVTAVFIGVCIGLLIARGTGNTTVLLARQWQEKYSVHETTLPATAGLININMANVEQLSAIPGIGTKTAENIIAYRQQNGPFFALEDLCKVEGIGSSTLEKIRDYITVEA